MKVWHKILVAPTVAIAFLLALGGVSYGMLTRQNAALEELARGRMSAFQVAADASQEMSEVHSNVYRLITWIANLKEDQIKTVNVEQRKKLDAVTKSLGDLAAANHLTAAEGKMVTDVLPKIAKYRKLMDDAIDISSIDVGTGAMSMQAADIQFQAVVKEMEALVALEKTLAQESYDVASAAFRAALVWLGLIVAGAVAAAVAIALFMSRAIVRPLQVAIGAADRIAGGDLTGDIRVTTSDETGQLLQALATMLQNLRELVGQVSGGAHTVADTSAQIAQGNLDLSQRTEEQASTLEETASSMEELTSTVTQNADNARQASQLAVNASEVARKGGQVVGQVVSTMTGISDSSKKIADIIGVIDGIAFQTNILALNAAVEAARAGEQGRGFAVVAAEVRSLAQRSAAAAKEIKELIGDSVGKVDAGTKLVDAAGRTMQEIVGSVKQVSDLIAEIAAASQEQSTGIGQVNTAITQMDQVVQQNASLVEEATAATESMKDQARTLLQTVARFNLGNAMATPVQEVTIQPIVTRAPLPPSIKARPSANLPAYDKADRKLVGNGEWKEF
ncbi:methyl-accepting chemotaxis protein [Ramlibacter paludis]|uniref:methyl-accepting chemotaxis protein n=1 Tax=Ramlibacter paludis TaxID=2908000 RepID=UPI0023DA40DE|nr:methyl-accepting chemotaxis protein [Ramlibacter paludis]